MVKPLNNVLIAAADGTTLRGSLQTNLAAETGKERVADETQHRYRGAKVIGFGLIGLGEVSWSHEKGYDAAREKANIVAVCDVDGAKASERAARHNAKAYTDFRDLLSDKNVEAVDIMLPHYLHFSVASAALEAGKHVIIEKPITVDWREGQQLCELARRKGVKFTVAENTRYVTAYEEAARFLSGGRLGDITLIRTFIYGSEMERLHDPKSWIRLGRESGGGATIDMAAHSLYLLKWLFGEFSDIQAMQWQYVTETEVPDNSIVAGRLKNGAIYTCQFTDTAEIPWGERLEVFGRKGSLIIDQLNNPPVTFYEGKNDFKGKPFDGVPFDPPNWKLNSMIAEVVAFVDAISNDTPPLLDPEDGVYAVKMIEKAYESANRGGRSVSAEA